MKDHILERFLRYVAINTQSDPDATTCPSSQGQLELASLLTRELKEMGLENAHTDEFGYVWATLPSNISWDVPVMGLIAHLDTSPDMPGENIHPLIHPNYNGEEMILNPERGIVMDTNKFPLLKQYVGQTLITSDGTTLLGADDKAGIAEIMTALAFLLQNQHIPHGNIKVAFTPDEEVGRGADHFDVKKFGADFAYTLDGGELGELQYENFNAAYAKININGVNIHPGEAHEKMINSVLLGMEFNAMLPDNETPWHTRDYEGFFHLTNFKGTVEKTTLEFIIRDHDNKKFEKRKNQIRQAAARLNEKYGSMTVQTEIRDQYYNMHNKILPVMQIVELAKQAMEVLQINPLIRPIRGGTDGARLSYMGLPCPNLFTGGHHFHGRYEFIPLESMEKATMLILKISELLTRYV